MTVSVNYKKFLSLMVQILTRILFGKSPKVLDVWTNNFKGITAIYYDIVVMTSSI